MFGPNEEKKRRLRELDALFENAAEDPRRRKAQKPTSSSKARGAANRVPAQHATNPACGTRGGNDAAWATGGMGALLSTPSLSDTVISNESLVQPASAPRVPQVGSVGSASLPSADDAFAFALSLLRPEVRARAVSGHLQLDAQV